QIDSLSKISAYDDALLLALQNLKIAKNTSSPLLLGKAQSDVANSYFHKGNYDSTQHYAKKAIALGTENNLPEVTTSALLSIGNIHYSKFEDVDAIATYQQIDSIAEFAGEKNPYVVKALFNLGKVLLRTYSVQDTFYIGKSEGYFRRAIKMASEINDRDDEHYGYIMLGNIFGQRKEYQKAKPYFKKSLAYFKNNGSIENVANIYWSLGIIETDLNNYDQADAYYKKRLALLTETGDPHQIANANRVYAGFLRRIERYKQAIPYLEEAYDYFKQSDAGSSGILLGVTKNLAESYGKTGDLERAVKFYELSLVHQDSLEARKQKSLALDLEAKYQTQKKEQEIALLKSQNELAEQQKRNQRNLFLGGIALTSLAGLFLFLLYRNRQKTNKKLRELDVAKSNFFANISHELRTPLSLIQGPVEQQLERAELSQQDRRNLTIAKKNTQQLATLVDQLLDLSKVESGFYKLNVSKAVLSTFLKSQAESFLFNAEKKSQQLQIKISIDENYYWFDTDILQKVVGNLLGNAVKYSPQNAKINFDAEIAKGNLSLSVKNTGVSLTKKELQEIFNRFHQIHDNKRGTGIGLVLTKELVGLHKGNIEAESSANSVAFHIEIPILEAQYSSEEKMTGSIPKTFGETYQENTDAVEDESKVSITESDESWDIILIVDDNEDLRTYLSSIFDAEFNIVTADNGSTGFQKALKHVPDLIITDLMMPEEDGLKLTENCKTNETTSHIPILMLTAKAGDENKLTGLETGADAYLTKPFNNKILKQTAKNLLESRRKLQERFSQEVILTPKDISISSYDERFLESLQNVLDNHLVASDFNSKDFAKALGMSRMQLHRKLKALTGQTTTEFIRGQRLKLAASLLQKSDVNISEIGYQVGFNDHSYFTKCFREIYGASPSEFSEKRSS
ncbi:MAG TPA: tetratricopeptide repeat protein, partial [Allomuricauda sp.]|nr:tetratricopeptide repeat protein [Allomuricauda sp.]